MLIELVVAQFVLEVEFLDLDEALLYAFRFLLADLKVLTAIIHRALFEEDRRPHPDQEGLRP
jgi:hypothetical protein